ncbi:MAG: hypothetical protein JSS81_12090 [Acidobacteria bacterium]|nr:hypothetical protein [Acidobacteriota bacterium]
MEDGKKQIKFAEPVNSRNAADYLNDGYELICPRCKSVLDIRFYTDRETGRRSPVLIACPKNDNHIYIIYEPAGAFKEMRKLFSDSETSPKGEK